MVPNFPSNLGSRDFCWPQSRRNERDSKINEYYPSISHGELHLHETAVFSLALPFCSSSAAEEAGGGTKCPMTGAAELAPVAAAVATAAAAAAAPGAELAKWT